ncbi:recombinase family protein [Berryella intestinalis]|uniref:recombinase family protein n=1 Tax=Berryella intestinalis TaxID=1531429 RepID=UPI0039BF9484
MRTAVIYARFSCAKQREASIEDQLRVCKEWCSREGYAAVREYCDYAVSGRTDDRPQFQEMIANAGESEIVLVYMMDRFSRDVYDAPIYKKRLRDKGVKVVSATEAMPDGPEAILIEHIYEAMAAMESAHTSQRVTRGMQGNARKCLHNGVTLYGYSFGDDGRYVVNEEQAEIVRECFARKIAGEPVNAIAKDLAKRGIRPFGKSLASYGFVYNILNSEKYTGVYIWGDVRVDGGMPAIVSKGDLAMAKAAKPKKQRASEDWGEFILSGKAICEGCGMNLAGTSGRGRHGIKYEYYKCAKGCGVKPVRADWLEHAIVQALRELLSNREKALRIASIIAEHAKDECAEKKAAKAKRRKAEAEKGIDRLMDAIANGLDLELAKGKIDELQKQVEVAKAEIMAHETASVFSAEDFADFLQFGSTLDDAMLLKAFVYQVMVGDEDVTVTMNYDIEKSEPARLKIKRVRTDSSWWTVGDSNPGPWD